MHDYQIRQIQEYYRTINYALKPLLKNHPKMFLLPKYVVGMGEMQVTYTEEQQKLIDKWDDLANQIIESIIKPECMRERTMLGR